MNRNQIILYAVIDILYALPVALNVHDVQYHLRCKGLVVTTHHVSMVLTKLAASGMIIRHKRQGVRLPFYYYGEAPLLPGIEEQTSR